MNLKHHKVVSSLPGTLESNSIYYVRTGAGFEIYVTNDVGTIVAYSLNGTSSGTEVVDQSFLCSNNLGVQDMNANGVATITNDRSDTNWATTATTAQYTGNPDSVVITAQVHQTGAVQRSAPQLILQKNISGTWTNVTRSSTGYIRNGSGHTESSNTIAYTDPAPGTNPQYRLQKVQESTNGGVTNSTAGSFFQLTAIEKITVLI